MAHFTLRQLKYFVTVVEYQSIAEASRHLHIAQPSISSAIKGLEENFDRCDAALNTAFKKPKYSPFQL